jgi:hypothetical protein
MSNEEKIRYRDAFPKDYDLPAFPIFPETGGGHAAAFQGMTLRDYFAAKSLSSPICLELSSTNNWDNERRSEWAYKQADAMLKAREA